MKLISIKGLSPEAVIAITQRLINENYERLNANSRRVLTNNMLNKLIVNNHINAMTIQKITGLSVETLKLAINALQAANVAQQVQHAVAVAVADDALSVVESHNTGGSPASLIGSPGSRISLDDIPTVPVTPETEEALERFAAGYSSPDSVVTLTDSDRRGVGSSTELRGVLSSLERWGLGDTESKAPKEKEQQRHTPSPTVAALVGLTVTAAAAPATAPSSPVTACATAPSSPVAAADDVAQGAGLDFVMVTKDEFDIDEDVEEGYGFLNLR